MHANCSCFKTEAFSPPSCLRVLIDCLFTCLINRNATKGVVVTNLDRESTGFQTFIGVWMRLFEGGGSSQTSMQVNNGHNLCYHMQSTMLSFVQWHTNVAPNAPLLMLSSYSDEFPRDQCMTSRNWTGFHYYFEDNSYITKYLSHRVINSVNLGLSKTLCCSFWHRLSYNGFNPEKASWINCFFAGNVSPIHV